MGWRATTAAPSVGSLLRRTGLDELPQLFNVARGEMSIVGPRPEREELVPWFEREVYRYRERHRMKPGITGWAQVHGLRGKTSLADRVEWDNYYIENWSPWLDFKILRPDAGGAVSARHRVGSSARAGANKCHRKAAPDGRLAAPSTRLSTGSGSAMPNSALSCAAISLRSRPSSASRVARR